MDVNRLGLGTFNRCFLKDMLGMHLAVTVVLLLVIVGGNVARMLREAAEGRIPADIILPLVMLGSVKGLILLLPVSLFLALMLGLGRLYKDNEMAALRACGVGPGSLYVAITWVTVPMMLLLTVLVFWGAPLASTGIDQIRIEAEQRSDLVGVSPGRFLESRVGGRVFFVEGHTADGTAMRDVFIQSTGPDGMEVVTARRAETRLDPDTGQRYLVLRDGYRYVGEPGGREFRILDFEIQGIRVPDPEGSTRVGKVDTLPTAKLLGSERRYERAELQWRISMVISMVLLAALVLPLSHTTNPRQDRYARLTVAIIIYIVYANFMILGRSWFAKGQTPEWMGMWWIHGVMAVLLLALLWRQRGLRRRRRVKVREAPA